MDGLKSFLFFNQLSQLEVANFLGISKSYMSKLVSGTMKLKPEQFEKLKTNNKGWNTEFLTDAVWSDLEKMNMPEPASDELSSLKRENELLREQLAKSEERNSEYWSLIKELTKNKA